LSATNRQAGSSSSMSTLDFYHTRTTAGSSAQCTEGTACSTWLSCSKQHVKVQVGKVAIMRTGESSMVISAARCLSSLSRVAFMQVLAVMLSTMTVSQSPLAKKALLASHHKAALSAARHLSQSFHMLRYGSFAMHLCGRHHCVHLHGICEPI